MLSSALFFIFLNLAFYPSLLKYQSGSLVAFYNNKYYPKEDIVVSYNNWLLQYYSRNNLHHVQTIDELKKEIQNNNKILVADESFYKNIKNSTLDFEVLKVFENYTITNLTADFLYFKTREKTL